MFPFTEVCQLRLLLMFFSCHLGSKSTLRNIILTNHSSSRHICEHKQCRPNIHFAWFHPFTRSSAAPSSAAPPCPQPKAKEAKRGGPKAEEARKEEEAKKMEAEEEARLKAENIVRLRRP